MRCKWQLLPTADWWRVLLPTADWWRARPGPKLRAAVRGLLNGIIRIRIYGMRCKGYKAAARAARARGAAGAGLGCARAGRAGRGALRSRSAVGWYHGRRARGLYRRWGAGKSTMPLLCLSPLL